MNSLIGRLTTDWEPNRGRPKSQFALLFFRAASIARTRFGPKHPLAIGIGFPYRITVEWVLGIELPWQLEVGPRLRLFHGQGLVVNPAAQLGADVTLRHGVTIGNRRSDFDCPVIGNGVDIGATSAVLGDIHVGDGATIGAHSVVLSDVPAHAVVVGNPARIIPLKEKN